VTHNEPEPTNPSVADLLPFPCLSYFDQLLEPVVKVLLQQEEVNATLGAARDLVKYFKSSSHAHEKLMNLQYENNPMAVAGPGPMAEPLAAVSVIEDDSRCWWSTYDMCERLIYLQPFITNLATAGEIIISLTEIQWEELFTLTILLEPFKNIQQYLDGGGGGESAVLTCSFIPMFVKDIRERLKLIRSTYYPDSTECPAEMKETMKVTINRSVVVMLEMFEQQWGGSDEDEDSSDPGRGVWKGFPLFVLMAVAMDPRTKKIPGIPISIKNLIWEAIRERVIEESNAVTANASDESSAASIDQEQKNNSKYEFWNRLLDDPDDIESVGTRQELLQSEILHYRRQPLLGITEDPILWWRKHHHEYPTLSRIAQPLLAIPATSVASKKVFSQNSRIITDHRSNLKPEDISNLVLLKGSWSAVEVKKDRKRKLEVEESSVSAIPK
jgi:hypothetical protein